MDPAKRAFYRFHASLMEPWDGPASVAFTDGEIVGAVLDRNGLRPGRWWQTDDGLVVLGSEAGVLDLDPAHVVAKGRLQPGRMFLVDTVAGRIVHDDEIKSELAAAQPYGEWLHAGLIELDDLPRARAHRLHPRLGASPAADLRLHRGGAEDPARADGPHRRRAARLDGHGHPDLAAVHPAAAALRLLPPALRPGHQPAAGRHPGGAGDQPGVDHRAGGQPARPGRGELPADRAPVPDHRQRRAGEDPLHRRGRRPARLQGGPGLRALPDPGRRRRDQGPADRDLPARLRGDRGRRPHPGALRPGLQRRPGADPVAAAHRRRAPAPGARADPYPGGADRGVRRLPRGAPRGGADRLRRGGGQPVPGLRVGRGPGRHRRAGRGGARRRRSATTSRRSARAS